MASEQMLRRVEFNETLLEIREVHIQKQREGDNNKKKQDIQELQADRAMSQNKEAERKGREEATKGLRDREEKEIRDKMEAEYAKRTMEHTFQEYTARKKQEESETKKVAQNKESKERPSEKATIKSFEERQEQAQGGIEKPGAVCKTAGKVSPPHRANESNTMESFQGVQERDKAKKQGVFGETKIQQAEKMNKTDESLQSQEGGRKNNVYASYADAVKANDCTKRVQEQELNENIAEKSFEGEKEQPQGGVVHMVKEPLHNNKVTDGGSTVLGAVGETVAEIGENMMKPAEKVREKSEEGKGGGVLGAIGETVAEIAQTTKVLALGEGETETKQSIG